jgi:hypothetical protein
VIWSGETKRGFAAKLCFRDGSKVFWADGNEVQITKTYRDARSIRSLQEFAAAQKQLDQTGHYPDGHRYECEECGEWVTAGEGSCWETGCAH